MYATKVRTYPSSCLSFLPDFSDLSGCIVSLEKTTASCELTQLPIVLYARLQFLFLKQDKKIVITVLFIKSLVGWGKRKCFQLNVFTVKKQIK